MYHEPKQRDHGAMRKAILVLLLAVASDSAAARLPPCPGSYRIATWTNCFAELTNADGGTYVGEFKDGKFDGQGTYTFPDGQKYVGEWRDDRRSGHGTKYRADGTILQSGIGENGVFVGSR